MMSTRQIVALAVAYTVAVVFAMSFVDVSGAVVFGIAAAWFSVGRIVGRNEEVPARRTRWGRQR